MARERLRVKRQDSTDFGKAVKSSRPSLQEIDIAALENFSKPAAPEPKPDDQKLSKAEAHSEDVQTPAKSEPAAGSSNDDKAAKTQEPEQKTRKADRQRNAEASDDGLVDLVIPPRARRAADKISISLRLRVLERHVPDLQELEERGFTRGTVFKAAFNRMPKISFEPRYVPQVQEPSGRSEFSLKWTPSVPVQTINSIAKQVRDGDQAPKTALIMGQVEPAWFAALDATIERLLK